jgi:hypothetical protein
VLTVADEAEAFIHGRLAEVRVAAGLPDLPWLRINGLAHGSLDELHEIGSHRDAAIGRPDDGWTAMYASLARGITERVDGPGELRAVQCELLWPLEAELIESAVHISLTPSHLFRLAVGALRPLLDVE